LPTSPPPVLPSPPVPTSVITSTSSQAACTDVPASTKNPSFESKDVDSVDEFVASCPSGIAHNSDSDANRDGGNCGEVAPVSLRDEPTRSVMSLPPPPPQPAEENTVGTDSDMEMEG
jgi:hypothetical protein